MADPRSDAITAIRTRLATVADLWPIAYHKMEFIPTVGTPYIRETFAGGTEVDCAIPSPDGKRWNDTTENYQLELLTPVNTDPRVAIEMACDIARTMRNTPITLPGGWNLWFTNNRTVDRGLTEGWNKVVMVLTYRYIYNA